MLALLVLGQLDRIVGVEMIDRAELLAIGADHRHVRANLCHFNCLHTRNLPRDTGQNRPGTVSDADGVPAGCRVMGDG